MRRAPRRFFLSTPTRVVHQSGAGVGVQLIRHHGRIKRESGSGIRLTVLDDCPNRISERKPTFHAPLGCRLVPGESAARRMLIAVKQHGSRVNQSLLPVQRQPLLVGIPPYRGATFHSRPNGCNLKPKPSRPFKTHHEHVEKVG